MRRFSRETRRTKLSLISITKKAGLLDGDEDTEIDLASYAYQNLEERYRAGPYPPEDDSGDAECCVLLQALATADERKEGVLVYLKTGTDNDALSWVDLAGKRITDSQFTILKAAACPLEAPAAPRHPNHHDLVQKAVEDLAQEEKTLGGSLGDRLVPVFEPTRS